MQFLVTAYDGTDSEAQARRSAARASHIMSGDEMRDRGELLFAVAILGAEGQMVGSCMIVEFQTRQDLDVWLKNEPYVTGQVWQKVDILPCKVGPSFARS